MHPVPIVIAAFGTTFKSMASYDHLAARFKVCFPEHKIFWTWSSRIIKEKTLVSTDQGPDSVSNPQETLTALYKKGYSWAVVQSLHLLGGHEFSRLVAETSTGPIRSSIGLPLLSSPSDFRDLCAGLAPLINTHPEQAIILVGHGTDHPAWCAYPALQYFLRRHFGPRVFVGVIEEGCPAGTEVIADIQAAGYKKVCIIPLLLVAGMHFHRDLTGDGKNSWMTRLSQADISVEIIKPGIGILPVIGEIFCRHIEDALQVIPDSKP
jgi:sirohydrochlorin cobaltochelatase